MSEKDFVTRTETDLYDPASRKVSAGVDLDDLRTRLESWLPLRLMPEVDAAFDQLRAARAVVEAARSAVFPLPHYPFENSVRTALAEYDRLTGEWQ